LQHQQGQQQQCVSWANKQHQLGEKWIGKFAEQTAANIYINL